MGSMFWTGFIAGILAGGGVVAIVACWFLALGLKREH